MCVALPDAGEQVAVSREVHPGVVLHLDAHGALLGLELDEGKARGTERPASPTSAGTRRRWDATFRERQMRRRVRVSRRAAPYRHASRRRS